jgi:hypothetical protein
VTPPVLVSHSYESPRSSDPMESGGTQTFTRRSGDQKDIGWSEGTAGPARVREGSF